MSKARGANGIRTAGAYLAALLLMYGNGLVCAGEITLSGSTSGAVVGAPPLSFAGNTFTGTTFGGAGALSGANRLGTFSLSTAPPQTLSGTFILSASFFTPVAITGGPGATFTASIQGSVSSVVNQGGVFIDFGGPQTFTFNDGTNSGSFTLTIADVFVQTGQTSNVTAGFTGSQAPVPEPGTLALLGFGLAGVAASLRKLRR